MRQTSGMASTEDQLWISNWLVENTTESKLIARQEYLYLLKLFTQKLRGTETEELCTS